MTISLRNIIFKMKKSILFAAAMLAMGTTAKADEGMWTLYNLPDAVYEQMRAEGFELGADQLFTAPGALSNYVVNFGGYCSGVVVSPNGLVFTNHHCGFSAINAHSTVEHDYMIDGFYAKTYEEELPNDNLFISFMKNQEDITARVNALINGQTRERTAQILDSLENALTDSVKLTDKTLHVSIKPFYEGNKYYATTYQDFTDVRLVFTVPKSMGKFGGETDNWMWPRQTCDYSVFRIYADPKTNGPAAYSKDNVPYRPQHWAPVSLQGYEPGSFAMTIGYPGSTSRYLSSYGIQERRDISNATRIQSRAIKLAIMKKYMSQSEKTRIQYEDTYVGAANYYKNSIGMNHCIDSIGLIRDKAQYEAKIQQWLASGASKDPYVNVDFGALKQAYADRASSAKAIAYWQESFYNVSELLKRGIRIFYGREAIKGGSDPKKQYVEFDDNSDTWNLDLDKELTAAMMKNYSEQVPQEFWPAFFKTTVQKQFKGDFVKYTEWLYKKSALLKKGAKLPVGDKDKLMKDPAMAAVADIMAIYRTCMDSYLPADEAVQAQEKKLCEAKVQMEMDMPHYSDANFTMRLSYGQVGGYMMGNHDSGYYTDAASIIGKMDKAGKIEDYATQPIMRELMSASDYGRYQDKKTGKMQLCFLTNNDITGGNSGSPIFNGKGQLIGLAFDGNWDSLASDINFDRKLARCIGVDVRYMLYLMDKWGHADRLLNEINPQ